MIGVALKQRADPAEEGRCPRRHIMAHGLPVVNLVGDWRQSAAVSRYLSPRPSTNSLV